LIDKENNFPSLPSAPCDGYPGSTMRKLTVTQEDSQGRKWARGTRFVPLTAGIDNGAPGGPQFYQRVDIGGATVIFFLGAARRK